MARAEVLLTVPTGQPELFGDLGFGQLVEVAQHDDRSLVAREHAEEPGDLRSGVDHGEVALESLVLVLREHIRVDARRLGPRAA